MPELAARASIAAASEDSAAVTNRIDRGRNVSAAAPATADSSRIGANWHTVTRASARALSVSSTIHRLNARFWNQTPVLEAIWPVK